MKQELQEKLYTDFPLLFDNRNKSPMESPMAFGIECGDGWYDIIRSVCWEIKQHENHVHNMIKWKQKEDPDYILPYYSVKFDQIKEKYGGLRIYCSGGDDHIKGVICMAEDISYKICENCGNRGEPNKSGWIQTLCKQCKEYLNM